MKHEHPSFEIPDPDSTPPEQWHELEAGQIHDPEEYRHVLEHFFTLTLLSPEHARMINEGNNGVILQLSLDPEFLHDLDPEEQLHDVLGDEHSYVAKILKVYGSREAGQQEYENQLAAWTVTQEAQALEKQTNPSDNDERSRYANVPRPYFFTDLSLTPELSSRLSSMGVDARDNASVLLMDMVEGQDVARVLYTTLLKKHPDAAHLQHEKIEEWRFEELSSEVARLFYYKPANERNDTDAQAAAYRLMQQNAERLMKECGRIGVKTDPHIIAQLKRTIRLFAQRGILHRDAHPRNFMITGDMAHGGNATVIDYGNVTLLGRPVEERDYTDVSETERYGRMENIVHLLEGINRYSEQFAATESGRKDPKSVRLQAIKSGASLLRQSNEGILGFPVSKDRRKNKLPMVEKAIGETLDEYIETGTWDMAKLRSRMRDESGKRIKQSNTDKSEKTELWNSNALLTAILGKVYERAINGDVEKKDIAAIVEALLHDEQFAKVINDNDVHRYWTGWNVPEELPVALWDEVVQKRKNQHEDIKNK